MLLLLGLFASEHRKCKTDSRQNKKGCKNECEDRENRDGKTLNDEAHNKLRDNKSRVRNGDLSAKHRRGLVFSEYIGADVYQKRIYRSAKKSDKTEGYIKHIYG